MPFELTIGRPGQGKSMYTAKLTLELLERSKRIYEKGIKCDREQAKNIWKKYLTVNPNDEGVHFKKNRLYGLKRIVAINFHLSKSITEKYKPFIKYWNDPMELITMKDFDLVIDEIANYFPSDKWKDTHHEVRRMFSQHRKRGMEIYANTQDYRMVDINCRRMLSTVFQLYKIVGSRSPSATLPEIKHPWGIIMQLELDPETLEDDKEKERLGWPEFFFITKKLTSLYDTTEDIKPAPPPHFHHIDRTCLSCGFAKQIHI